MTGWRGAMLKAGIAGLYLGIFLAGMALPFAVALPVALALMLLYTVLMRPVAQWAPNAVVLGISLLTLAALSALIVLAAAGLARLTGAPPAWFGPALGLAGIAASRASWSARKAGEMDAFLDDALNQLQGFASSFPAEEEPAGLSAADAASVSAALERLAALPNDPPEAPARPETAAQMEAILAPLERPDLWQAAADALYSARREHLPNLEASALFLLRERVAWLSLGQFQIHDALLAAVRSRAGRIAISTAAAAERALAEAPELWIEIPDATRLRAAAADLLGPPEARAALERLAQLQERAAAEDGNIPAPHGVVPPND